MSKIYEVEYEIDVKKKLLNKKEDIIKDTGKFWEHAIRNIDFMYELDEGDVKKAKAIAGILKLLAKKVDLVKKNQMIKEVNKDGGAGSK